MTCPLRRHKCVPAPHQSPPCHFLIIIGNEHKNHTDSKYKFDLRLKTGKSRKTRLVPGIHWGGFMCGIAGVSARNPVQTDMYAARLSGALAHRGPDGQGEFTSKHMSLYHRRLAIVDPEGGKQPFISKSGNALVMNGMIYNYRELQAGLPYAEFQTKCDAESPLHVYEKHGEEFTSHLRGMYALALYDAQQDLLILARDPYGIKPLYYTQNSDMFAFASEPQALIKSGIVAAELDRDKAVELLQLKFVTGRQTAFSGIERVLPGEMIFVKNGEIIRRTRHDAFALEPTKKTDKSTVLSILDNKIRETVKRYTRSDVGFGVFLSGGVDSCSIMAALKAESISDFPCYTAHFPDGGLHDETRIARQVAKTVGAKHISVPITAGDFWKLLPDVITHVDDPSLDPAMIANFILARRAHADNVKVVLGGDGGDEIFAGYRRYERASLPRFLAKKRLRSRGQFAANSMMKFAHADWRHDFAEVEAQAHAKTHTRLQAFQATDGADFLPHFHLMKLDRCLMAYGIEGRVPFLDQDLAGFGYGLPDNLKLRRRTGKWLLRQWLHRELPIAKPFNRKRGFSTPVNQWITDQAPRLRPFVCEQPGIREYFEIDKVNDLFMQPNHDQRKLRWTILFFAMWHNIHILQKSADIF